MFHASKLLTPPCEAGRGPTKNFLMCERCGVGQYAPALSYCQECPEGGKTDQNKLKLWRRCHGCYWGGWTCLSRWTPMSTAIYHMCRRFNSFCQPNHVRKLSDEALLFCGRVLGLQLAVGFGGQQLRSWAINENNTCFPLFIFLIISVICLPKGVFLRNGP